MSLKHHQINRSATTPHSLNSIRLQSSTIMSPKAPIKRLNNSKSDDENNELNNFASNLTYVNNQESTNGQTEVGYVLINKLGNQQDDDLVLNLKYEMRDNLIAYLNRLTRSYSARISATKRRANC